MPSVSSIIHILRCRNSYRNSKFSGKSNYLNGPSVTDVMHSLLSGHPRAFCRRRKQFGCVAVVFALLFLSGCATARYPIDAQPLVKIDAALLGKWKTTDKKDVYTMARKSDFEYLLTLKVRGRQDFEKFPAFLSVINNERFLNFAQIENDSLKGYSFARLLSVESSGNKISCAIVEPRFCIWESLTFE